MRWNYQIYLLKKSESDEIISFKFPFIDNRYLKRLSESTTPWLGKSTTPRRLLDSASRWLPDSVSRQPPWVDNSPTRWVDDSPTRGVDNSPTRWVDDSPTRQVNDSLTRWVGESLREKRQHQGGRRSSSPLRNSRKKTIFCLKTSVEFIESLSLKSLGP